ncbi:hypothetical protein MKW94_015363 [Papaver nudicaule]|uniref:RRM domain-containing protein n=1 Tax=Papaver nudicaule TaxID=74823 RepID=A0AA41VN71_PAPNU|nr:hypothetical protein [Papaver nudicaule]
MGTSSKNSDVAAGSAAASPVVESGGKKRYAEKHSSSKDPENRHRSVPCTKKPNIGTAAASSKMEKARKSIGAYKTVVARNLPDSVNKSGLIKFFEQAGEVVKASYKSRHKQNCFIEFATDEAAEKALEFDGQNMCNNNIRVVPLLPKASRTLAAVNLSYSTTKSDLTEFFEQAGEIRDVRFSLDQNGGFNGNCRIEFVTAEAATKAVALRGNYLLGRPVILGFARETLFIRGFDTSLQYDQVYSSLLELFSTCGRISWMDIPAIPYSGIAEGFAFIEYFDSTHFHKALALNGHKLGDSTLKVQDATPGELVRTPPGDSVRSLPARRGGSFNPSMRHFPVRGYDGAGIGKIGSIYHTPSGKKFNFDDD